MYPNDTTEVCIRCSALVAEELGDPGPELVDVELPGVEHHVRPVADGPKSLALVGDRVFDVAPPERMAPSGPLEPPDQDVVGSVEVDDAHLMARSSQLVDRGKGLCDLSLRHARSRAPPGPDPDSGAPTTSATSASSEGGMLSITYHPASSSAAAVVERPAPDIPVMSR